MKPPRPMASWIGCWHRDPMSASCGNQLRKAARSLAIIIIWPVKNPKGVLAVDRPDQVGQQVVVLGSGTVPRYPVMFVELSVMEEQYHAVLVVALEAWLRRMSCCFAWWGRSHWKTRLASMDPPIPKPTPATTSHCCSAVREPLSVSRALGQWESGSTRSIHWHPLTSAGSWNLPSTLRECRQLAADTAPEEVSSRNFNFHCIRYGPHGRPRLGAMRPAPPAERSGPSPLYRRMQVSLDALYHATGEGAGR
jgi:hypothetical protein